MASGYKSQSKSIQLVFFQSCVGVLSFPNALLMSIPRQSFCRHFYWHYPMSGTVWLLGAGRVKAKTLSTFSSLTKFPTSRELRCQPLRWSHVSIPNWFSLQRLRRRFDPNCWSPSLGLIVASATSFYNISLMLVGIPEDAFKKKAIALFVLF